MTTAAREPLITASGQYLFDFMRVEDLARIRLVANAGPDEYALALVQNIHSRVYNGDLRSLICIGKAKGGGFVRAFSGSVHDDLLGHIGILSVLRARLEQECLLGARDVPGHADEDLGDEEDDDPDGAA